MHVFGTAAPTDEGLQDVCSAAAPAGQVIVWCNLRQEPYVYINGSPYCLKDRHNPFKNMLNTGILAADVEHAEVFLKMEVLAEARKNGAASPPSVPLSTAGAAPMRQASLSLTSRPSCSACVRQAGACC
jgi:hypothetical protein